MNNNPINIMLVDDHIILRDALANLIHDTENIRVVGVASNGEELIKRIKEGIRPELILLDLNMPVMDGYQTSEWLSKNHPEIKIVVLTMFDSEIALIRLLQDGVRGFLKKDVHPQELRYAIRTVCEDGYYYSSAATNKLASLFKKTQDNPKRLEKAILNPVEIEFLKMISTDLTYKEIAVRMKMSTRIIDSHRDNLFEKLDVKSRVGLAIYAVKNGIVTF